MIHLSLLDWTVVALFVTAILALGFSAKLRDNSILQYLAAGRALSLPAFVATLVTTWYGGILGSGEAVKDYGIGSWLLLGVPYYVFALVYAFFFAGRVRSAEQISIPERLAARWGKEVGLLSAVLIFLLAVPATQVLMLGVLIHAMTDLSQPLAIVLATLIGTLFLYRGGLLADVRAGMLAFVMMYVGFLLIVGYCLVHFPPSQAFRSLDPKLFQWTGSGAFTLFGFFILGAWTIVDPAFHQRVSSAASPQTGRKGVFVSVGFWFLFDVLTTVSGLYALALVKPEPEGLLVFPALGEAILPSGLKAVFVCGMLGTILCAMVSYTLVSGATLGREIVARAAPGMDDSQIKNWTRLGVLVACLVAIVLALGLKSVVDLWYWWGGTLIGALLIPVCAAYLPKWRMRASPRWVFASMALAFAVSFGWLVYGKRTHHDDLSVVIRGQTYALGTMIPSLLVSALALAAGQLATKRIEKHG